MEYIKIKFNAKLDEVIEIEIIESWIWEVSKCI